MTERKTFERHIEQGPILSGTDGARLRGWGISVWVLVAYYEAAGGDIDQVAADYALPREAVEAALAYYRQHKVDIDARIAEHDTAFT